MNDTLPKDTGPADPEEAALVRGLQDEDPEQVRAFLERTHGPVYAMTARLTRDPDLRHDWCQDILLKIVREMAGGRFVYRRAGSFWAWFRMRAHFLLLNLYQQHKKHRERWSTGEIGAALAEAMPLPPGADPVHLLESVEARRAVEDCLDELASDDHRRALHLLLFEEQAYDEIAAAMGAALNTVRSWIRRARVSTRRCVARRIGREDPEGA